MKVFVMISRRAVVCHINGDADYDMRTNYEHSNVLMRMFV
jgi:hypothetical protein